jgi:ketosteroid isomerase-like protein
MAKAFVAAVVTALGIASAVIVLTGQKANDTSSVKAQLERLVSQWMAAFDKGDGETMDKMEVSNLVLVNTDGRGNIFHKPGPRAGKIKPTDVQSRTLSDTDVRQFGDTAILTSRVTTKGPSGSEDAAMTVVCVRQNNQWLVASAQWSDVGANK